MSSMAKTMQSVTLTTDITQDAVKSIDELGSAAAYLVFDDGGNACHFESYKDAEEFAMDQMEESEDGTSSWSIYPLYAGEPNEVEY